MLQTHTHGGDSRKRKEKEKNQKKKVAHLVLISPAAMQVERESCLPMHSKQGAETRVKTTTTTKGHWVFVR
jgi:hypothetical protein